MKKLLLFTLLLALACAAHAQKKPRYNKIIVAVDSVAAVENYTMVGQKLVENGYTIEHSDDKLMIITSAPRPISKLNAVHKLSFVCKGKEIIVTGSLKLPFLAGDEFSPIEDYGMKGSIGRISYQDMKDFALKLGANITEIEKEKK